MKSEHARAWMRSYVIDRVAPAIARASTDAERVRELARTWAEFRPALLELERACGEAIRDEGAQLFHAAVMYDVCRDDTCADGIDPPRFLGRVGGNVTPLSSGPYPTLR